MIKKRAVSIGLIIAILSSVCCISGIIGSAANTFSQDLMEVGFENYKIVTEKDNPNAYNTYTFNSNVTETLWSVETDTDDTNNKYMQFKKTADQSKTGWKPAYAFFLNPTGSTSNSGVFKIVKGATYKVTFKYKLSFDDLNGTSWRSVAAELYTNQWNKLDGNMSSLSSKLNLPAADEWTEKEIEISSTQSNKVKDNAILTFTISPNSSASPSDKFGFTFCLDDVKVERIYSYWQGNVAESYAGGTGAANDPYQISNAAQLALLAKTVNDVKSSNTANPTTGKYYALTADIDLNDVDSPNWQNNSPNKWFHSVSLSQAFCGVLNGQGHSINGIYINEDTETDTFGGLFGALGENAEIKNLAIKNSYIKAKYSGGIAGYASGKKTVVRRCFTAGNITAEGKYTAGLLGGSSSEALIENSYTYSSVNGSIAAAALIADANGKTTVNNCWAAIGNYPLISGDNSKITAKNSYSTATLSQQAGITNVSEGDIIGNGAKTAMSALDFNEVWAAKSGQYPELHWQAYGYTAEDDYNDDAVEGAWSGKIAKSYHGGDGSRENPYQISTAEELALLSNTVKGCYWNNYATKNKYYELISDIVINDTTADGWMSNAKQWFVGTSNSQCFNGVFNGNGHTVSGLYINSADEKAMGGLFIALGDGAVVKNIGFKNSYLKAANAGTVAGTVENRAQEATPRIVACYADESVTVEASSYAGGLVAYSPRPLVLRYCYFKGSVIGNDVKKVGALVAASWDYDGNIKYRSCYSAPENEVNMVGSVSAATKATNCYATFNKRDTKVILADVEIMTVERMTGTAALENMTKFDFEQVWIPVNGGTPALRVFTEGYSGIDPDDIEDPFERRTYDGAKPGDIWSGGIATKYNGGDGNRENPYQIATGEQLAFFVESIRDSVWDHYATKDKYYVITDDIYLNDVKNTDWYENAENEEWLTGSHQAQAFCGNLNGNGHIIYGLFFKQENASLCALIPSIGQNAVVENLGIASSYVYNGGSNAGGLFAYVENRSYKTGMPTIRRCFVAEDVSIISSSYAGGLIAGTPSTVSIEDCYSLAYVEGTATRTGGLIGYSWYNGTYQDDDGNVIMTTIKNSFVANADKSNPIGSLTYKDYVSTENLYALRAQSGICSSVSFGNMTDEKAKEYLKNFDFESIWQTVEKSTPVLKIFADRKIDLSKISRLKGPVTVSFETYGGSEVPSVSGESGSKLTLPTATRKKDVFDGWYVYNLKTYDIPFTYDYFPDDDITLYAKWIEKGNSQGFEDYDYSDEDGLEEGFEVYKPGSDGYDGAYVYNGIKSLHRTADEADYKNACLFGTDAIKLVPGNEYELSMYVYLKGTPSKNDKLMLAYTEEADWAYDENATETICALSSLQSGKWQLVTFKFVAYGNYIALRVPGVEMFFDDAYVLPTDRTGLKSLAVKSTPKTVTTVIDIDGDSVDSDSISADNTKKTTKKIIRKIIKKKNNKQTDDYTLYIVIGSAAAVLLVAGAVTGICVAKKKRVRKGGKVT